MLDVHVHASLPRWPRPQELEDYIKRNDSIGILEERWERSKMREAKLLVSLEDLQKDRDNLRFEIEVLRQEKGTRRAPGGCWEGAEMSRGWVSDRARGRVFKPGFRVGGSEACVVLGRRVVGSGGGTLMLGQRPRINAPGAHGGAFLWGMMDPRSRPACGLSPQGSSISRWKR